MALAPFDAHLAQPSLHHVEAHDAAHDLLRRQVGLCQKVAVTPVCSLDRLRQRLQLGEGDGAPW